MKKAFDSPEYQAYFDRLMKDAGYGEPPTLEELIARDALKPWRRVRWFWYDCYNFVFGIRNRCCRVAQSVNNRIKRCSSN